MDIAICGMCGKARLLKRLKDHPTLCRSCAKRGSNNPNWVGGVKLKTLTCSMCGRTWEVIDRKRNSVTTLCIKCRQTKQNNGNWKGGITEMRKGRIRKRATKVRPIPVSHYKECKCCEKMFTTGKSYKKYCCHKCQQDDSNRRNHRAFKHLRRARERNATGKFTAGDFLGLVELVGNRCPCCGKSFLGVKPTIDHIVPLSKGGSNGIENIQPLCLACNVRKQTATINYIDNIVRSSQKSNNIKWASDGATCQSHRA